MNPYQRENTKEPDAVEQEIGSEARTVCKPHHAPTPGITQVSER